ncbi:MAG: acetylglutamate kinase [Candidatus Omnitrophica bacterium]|nr:acetylglutamate kinase [Candidatus Omnitrophota bacterium]
MVEEAIKKSAVLIEALPYIKNFFGKTVIIKFGGSSLHDEEVRKGVIQDIVFMKYAGMKPILVHGGGPNINEVLEKENLVTKFINGLRVTCEKTMGIVDRVLLALNAELVSEIKSFGAESFGLSGKENNLMQTIPHKDAEFLGFVGEVSAIDTTVIRKLIDSNVIPVVAPIGKGKDNKIYNVNADDAASSLAVALSAEKFVLMTNVKGVMDMETGSMYKSLTFKKVKELIEKKIITGGMLPKVGSCLNALEGGVKKAHIVDASLKHALLLEIFTDEGIGTEIVV